MMEVYGGTGGVMTEVYEWCYQLLASYPGSQLIKYIGEEEESLVSTALRFKPDPRHS